MKTRQMLKKIAFSLFAVSSLISISSLLSVQPASANIGVRGCGGLQTNRQWLWDSRRFTANIYSDGTITANDGGTQITATWTCDNPNNGQITVRWSTGFVDTLTVSSDKRILVGGNQTGAQFNVVNSGRLASPRDLCSAMPGLWEWDTRAFPAAIQEDGTVSANDGGRHITATWTCNDSSTGSITVTWSTGFVDVLTLSESFVGGRTSTILVGSNNSGSNVTAVKVGSLLI